MGKTPSRGEKTFWNNDYNWVSISDMNDGSRILETKEKVSKKSFDNIFNGNISPKETLLMSFKLTIGKVSILDVDSFHNEAIISIYPYYDINYILRNYLFKILPLISNLGDSKNAIKGKTLNSKSINNLLIPIMNYNEMQKIHAKINNLEPLVHEYSKRYKKLEDLNSSYKEELKKSVLQYAIQGKLVKQDLSDESAEVLINKILDKKGELIKTKQIKKEDLSVIYKGSDNQFYEKFDDGTEVNITDEIPFDIPDSWSWVRLKTISKSINAGGDKPKYFSKEKNAIYKIPVISNGEKNDGIFGYTNSATINETALTISGRGTIGFSKVRNQSFTPIVRLLVVIPIKEIDIKYLEYSITSLVERGNGSAVKQLTVPMISPKLVPIPPIQVQKKIVNKLESIFKNL